MEDEKMKSLISVFIGCLLSLPLSAKTTLNSNIHVDAGEHLSSGCNSVNGSIDVGEGASIDGGCRSVNGSIQIESNCTTRDLQAVNGGIKVGGKTQVRGDIGSVNGPVECGTGVYVRGDVESVNGAIQLDSTEVDGGLETYNGDIKLCNSTVVHSDIVIKDSRRKERREQPLEIMIDNSVVEGDVIIKEDDLEVVVVLRNGGHIKGEVINACVQRQ
jgi:DUF4097 and DUF4098 domain-containing protein YvlB